MKPSMKSIVKKTTAVVLSSVLMVGLAAGCSKSSGNSGTSSKAIKAAILLSGPVNDQGWNAAGYAGIKEMKEKLHATISYTENVQASDYEQDFRNYASQGYNLIVGHGFEFGDAAKKVATQYPNVKFVVTSTTISQSPNVASVQNDSMQQGFLAGVVAAYMSKSKIIASVGGQEIPPITNFNAGFEAGAKYVNSSIQVLTTCTGSFDDAVKAKETATAMIQKGADVVTHDADAAGLGVIQAAKEANVYAIGSVGDQSSLAPDNVLVSSINDMGTAIYLAGKDVADGTLKPQSYTFGVKDGTINLVYNTKLESKFSSDVKSKIDTVISDIKSGKIDVASLAKK